MSTKILIGLHTFVLYFCFGGYIFLLHIYLSIIIISFNDQKPIRFERRGVRTRLRPSSQYKLVNERLKFEITEVYRKIMPSHKVDSLEFYGIPIPEKVSPESQVSTIFYYMIIFVLIIRYLFFSLIYLILTYISAIFFSISSQ